MPQSRGHYTDQDIRADGIVSIKFRAKPPLVRYQSIYLALLANMPDLLTHYSLDRFEALNGP